jgi:multidrug efflux pump subunit AcrA (membrane-fusion protein)
MRFRSPHWAWGFALTLLALLIWWAPRQTGLPATDAPHGSGVQAIVGRLDRVAALGRLEPRG